MKMENPTAARGRPRAFDAEEALEKALEVFWKKGYEGTTLPDLTEAMGINRPSLYAAFGNKEALFHKVIERYDELTGGTMREALAQPTARGVVENLLRAVSSVPENPCQPRGCLMVQGALVCSEESASIRDELTAHRVANEVLLRQRFERAQAEGDLPADAQPADLARFVATVQQGLSVQAHSGASAEELRRVVEIALSAWPIQN